MFDTITSKVKDLFKPQKDTNDPVFKDEIIRFVTEEFSKRQTERLPIELQMRLNINFYEGNQYVEINNRTKSIEEVTKIYWWQERTVVNQIAPIVETRLSKLNRLKPIQKTRPASDSEKDIMNAKVCNKLLESTYRKEEMQQKQSLANVWSELTGTAVFKTVWNANKGRPIGDMEGKEVFEGDLETIIVNPFEIYPDSIWNPNPKACRSIIHARVYHKDDIKSTWGKEVDGKEVNVFTVKNSNIGASSIDGSGGAYKVVSQVKKDSTIVYEFWERPTTKHKNGRLIICTEDELLHYGDLPYKLGQNGEYELPFVTQKSIINSNCFFGKSIIERLIPLQQRLNAIKNRKAEFLNRASIGQLLVEEGSCDIDYLENEGGSPGAIITYARGFNPPKYIQFHQLPQTFETEEANIQAQFISVSGVSEISRDSSSPTGVRSGIALNILQQEDETRLSLSSNYIKHAYISLGKFWLRFYKQFADLPRVLRTVGEDNTVEVLEWSKSMLNTDDIFIEPQSLTIESLAQRRQMVFDLLQYGAFNDSETGNMSKEGRQKLLEMIELGNWESSQDDIKLHIGKAERENRKILQGILPLSAQFDDDILHIQRHNRFRLTSEYEDIVAQNPVIAEYFDRHVQMHVFNIQMRIQGGNEQNG